MHDVLAAFAESIKSHKERVCGDLPLVLALRLVIKVCFLELGAHIDTGSEASVGFLGSVTLKSFENTVSVNEVVTLPDNGVTDLADEHDQAGRGVIVRGVGPDHEDGVHDGDEGLSDLRDVFALVNEIFEKVVEGLEILEVLVGLSAGSLHLFLELGESGGVGGLVLLEELEHLLDTLGVELLANAVQVITLVSPEAELFHGVGVLTVLQCVLGVLLQDVLDLTAPLHDSIYLN